MIKRSEVPEYLRKSDFYLSLNEEDDESLCIPQINFKLSTTVDDEHSLRNLLATLRFWGVQEILDEVYDAVVKDNAYDAVLSEFVAELRYLKVLSQLRLKSMHRKLRIVFTAGDLQVAKYLIEKIKRNIPEEIGKELTVLAAGGGHLDCLTYLHSLQCSWNSEACEVAARNGHCECLIYLHENGCEWSAEAVVQGAASYGHLPCLQYLVKMGCTVSSNTLLAVTYYDHVECLVYLHSLGIPWVDFGPWAAKNDALDCLKFALEHGCIFQVHPVLAFRSTQCLQLVHDSGFMWTVECANIVASSDKVELLKYVHELGCPWDVSTCVACIHSDRNIDCLIYAIKHGCPCDATALFRAGEKLNIVAMEYIYSSGCLDNGVPNTSLSHADFRKWCDKIYESSRRKK